MSSSALASIEEYLRTSYSDGDREFVDGRIVERNIGTVPHGSLQTGVLIHLYTNYRDIWTVVSCRVRVSATRVRVPDVLSVRGPKPQGEIITDPPFLVVEVLSEEDRAGDFQDKIDDYLSFGVPYVWVVNPLTRRGYVYTSDGMREAKDSVLRTSDPEIALPLHEID